MLRSAKASLTPSVSNCCLAAVVAALRTPYRGASLPVRLDAVVGNILSPGNGVGTTLATDSPCVKTVLGTLGARSRDDGVAEAEPRRLIGYQP